ncbi:MAG: hypothetical protein IKX33_10280 [Prevotella sp.]|nr:hypothetical protein [Prevotella sp.]
MEILYKNRSITSCLKAAYNLFLSNFKGIFHATWLPILLLSFFSAAFITLLVSKGHYDFSLLQHNSIYAVVLMALCLVCVFIGIWAMARLMSFLNEMPRIWNLKRMLIAFLVTLLAVAPLVFFLGGGIWLLFIHGDAERHFLMKILLLFVVTMLFSLLILPLIYVNMKYLKEKELNYLKSFTIIYKKGIRYVGFIFVASILTLLIAMVIISVVLMPLYVLLIAKTASISGEAMGDPSDLPGYFVWLVFGTMIVACIVMCLIFVYEMLVAYFIYGAIEQKQAERIEAKKFVSAVKE